MISYHIYQKQKHFYQYDTAVSPHSAPFLHSINPEKEKGKKGLFTFTIKNRLS